MNEFSVPMADNDVNKQVVAQPQEKVKIAGMILDNMPCIALLLKSGTREIVLSNHEAVKVGAIPGKKCFATWGQRQDPCPWCQAPAVWSTGQARQMEVEGLGVVWDAHWIPINGDLYIHYAFDITERKRAENALRESEERFRLAFEESPISMVIVNFHGRFTKVNKAMCQMLGYNEQELMGLSVTDISYAEDMERERPLIAQLCRGEISWYQMEKRYLLKNKGILWGDLKATMISDTNGKKGYGLGMIEDITERKRTEEKFQAYQEQLQTLTGQLSLIEQKERRRMAVELHDHVGQNLAYCQIKLGQLKTEISSPPFQSALEDIREKIDQAIQYTRSLTAEISPPILYEAGLESALKWLGQHLLSSQGIEVEFKDDAQPKPLDDFSPILLFQVVRELLMNVIKHARARRVCIAIDRIDERLRINIKDDGVGLDTSQSRKSTSEKGALGLFIVRERLKHIKGRLEIVSSPGQGTLATIFAPLKAEN